MSPPYTRLTPDLPGYPTLLAKTKVPPPVLYARGDISVVERPCVSIVGTRSISSYGEKVLRLIVPYLVKSGITIVSGLAYGVDSYAHKVALEHMGACAVVLGSGLDCIYPSANRRLFESVISAGGCAFTEYVPDMPALKHHFPARNRIVAGLSKVVVIIEAGEKSGTLITARCALEEGREVAVVPGDITRPGSKGILELLRQGAIPVGSPEEITALFGSQYQLTIPEVLQPALTGSLATLYDLISHGVEQVDDLLGRSGYSLQDIQSILSILELDGYIYRKGSTWQKI